MKVYVLIDEWARECEQECSVIGVYTTIERAREEMRKWEEKEFTTEMDTSEMDDNSIVHYDAGMYQQMHDRVFIEEKEIQD